MNPERSYTAIYYANDSDGDTFIFNESYLEKIEDISKLTIKKRVSPKKGRVVLFPANTLHAGSFPTEHEDRMVINYNVNLTPLEQTPTAEKALQQFFPHISLEN